MKHSSDPTLTIDDFFSHSQDHVIIFPSFKFLANVKKDQIILNLLRIEDLKKRISNSPKNKVLKLALLLAENKLRGQQKQYYKFVEHLSEK